MELHGISEIKYGKKNTLSKNGPEATPSSETSSQSSTVMVIQYLQIFSLYHHHYHHHHYHISKVLFFFKRVLRFLPTFFRLFISFTWECSMQSQIKSFSASVNPTADGKHVSCIHVLYAGHKGRLRCWLSESDALMCLWMFFM